MAAKPIEDRVPPPRRWPSCDERTAARVARLLQAIAKAKALDKRHPRLPRLRQELGLLTGLLMFAPRPPGGFSGPPVVVEVPAKRARLRS